MEGERLTGREGMGVTLTESVVDKTLRQIRQSRVWSLFCFPPLLLSGGISLLILSDALALSHSAFTFFFFPPVDLLNSSPTSSLAALALSKQKHLCYQPLKRAVFSPLMLFFFSIFHTKKDQGCLLPVSLFLHISATLMLV